MAGDQESLRRRPRGCSGRGGGSGAVSGGRASAPTEVWVRGAPRDRTGRGRVGDGGASHAAPPLRSVLRARPRPRGSLKRPVSTAKRHLPVGTGTFRLPAF